MSDEITQTVFSSMRQCAGATDVSLAVLKAAKAAGCDGFSSAGRVDFAKVKPWIDAHAAELQDQVEESSREYWSLERLKYQAMREKFLYESEQGKYLARETVSQQWVAVAEATKGLLKTTLEDELPQKLAGLDAIAIKELMAKSVDHICQTLQGGMLWE